MGLLGKAKEVVSGGSTGNDDPTFDDEFDGDMGEPDPEPESDPEPEPEPEWDTAYGFSDDVIKEVGFADMQEFITKAMVYKINQSPLYRDRIESGVQSMNMITDSMNNISEMQGRFEGEQGSEDYDEYVNQVRAANNLIDELDRMDGKEEQIANEVLGIARDAVDAMGNTPAGGGGSVDSSVGIVEEN